MTPILPRDLADALARKITEALVALGGNPTGLYLEAGEAGLLIAVTLGGKAVSVILPPDFRASYEAVATTLLLEAQMALPMPDTPRTIFAD